MADDIVAYLRAALDRDEETARAAKPGPWRWDDPHFNGEPRPAGCGEWGHDGPDLIAANDDNVVTSWGYDADCVVVARADAVHIARWDPARVLAEVQAKRLILDVHEPTGSDLFADGIRWCATCPRDDGWPCGTVRTLAQPYADHPDFDPAWRMQP